MVTTALVENKKSGILIPNIIQDLNVMRQIEEDKKQDEKYAAYLREIDNITAEKSLEEANRINRLFGKPIPAYGIKDFNTDVCCYGCGEQVAYYSMKSFTRHTCDDSTIPLTLTEKDSLGNYFERLSCKTNEPELLARIQELESKVNSLLKSLNQ